MPTYVYECKSCNAVFEADQSIKDDPLDTCVPCGAVGTIKRVIQPVGISFKGAGFHINDYAASGSKSAPSESAKTETESSDAPIPPEAPKPAEAAKPAAESTPATGNP